MPSDDDNIIKFKPQPASADSQAAQHKQELMQRIVAGSRRLRAQVRHEHMAYYASLGFILLVYMALFFITGGR